MSDQKKEQCEICGGPRKEMTLRTADNRFVRRFGCPLHEWSDSALEVHRRHAAAVGSKTPAAAPVVAGGRGDKGGKAAAGAGTE